MDHIQRAQRLLNSPIEGDHRKAIKLLAKSGDRRALALLRQAYDNAQTAEIKQMALKGGAYLKENLRAEVLAPAADPITFDLPEDHYGLDEPDTPVVISEQLKAQKSGVKSQVPWVVVFSLSVASIICMLQPWLVPWINLGNVHTASGELSFADSLAESLPGQFVRPAFSITDVIGVLKGKESPWPLFLNDDQIGQLSMNAANTGLDLSLNQKRHYVASYENWLVIFQIFVGLVVAMATNSLMLQGDYPQNKYFARKYKHEGYISIGTVLFGLFEVIPARILWLILLILGILLAAIQISFLFSIVPRFIEAASQLMNLGASATSPIPYLDYGFFIGLASCLTILISAIIGLTSDAN